MTTIDLTAGPDLAALEATLRGLDSVVPAAPASGVLAETAATLVGDGRGILAADESVGTIGKRLQAIGIEPSAESRRAYREMLLTAPGLGESISGVIFYDETIRQRADDGRTFPEVLADAGILTGIKADTGTAPMAATPSRRAAGAMGEEVTTGLDGLRRRLAEYHEMGARFAKWRVVIRIADGLPTVACEAANSQAMARYAALCQEAGIVPIVEPEILLSGTHSLATARSVSDETLRRTFAALVEHDVLLDGVVLKASMVMPGADGRERASDEDVAAATVHSLRACVPAAVPGVAFLSGGMTPGEATRRLDAMNRRAEVLPWRLTFSYGRALQEPAMAEWTGRDDSRDAAQRALVRRARCNAAAAAGAYDAEMEAPVPA